MVAAAALSFGMGMSNATLIQPVFPLSWNVFLGSNNIATAIFSDVFNVTSLSDVLSGGASVTGSLNLLGFNVFVDSFSLFDVTNSTTVASGVAGSSSVFSSGSLGVSDSHQLPVDAHLIGSNSSGSCSGNLHLFSIPEQRGYIILLICMVLICMVLIGFWLYYGKTRVSVASFACIKNFSGT